MNLSEILLDKVGAYVYVKDKERKYIYANKITQVLFNRELEDIIGTLDNEYFDMNTLYDINDNDTLVLDRGETVTDEEFNTIKATGEIRVYRSVKKPIYNNYNQIIGLLGISTDITDLHNLKEELKQQAITDPLSGVYNRRFFLETAERYFSEAHRHNKPLSLLLMDIDFFKHINDSYGHPVGDKIISYIGTYVSAIIRKEDVLARIGGDEFAILLPSTDINAAEILAEKIRSFFSDKSIDGEWNGTINLTACLGVTCCSQGDLNYDEMYLRADNALYMGKKQGRNKVYLQ